MDSDGGSSANKLQHDIERLQREIRMLSASKSVSRRSEIRRELADHDNSMAEYGRKGTGRSQAAKNRPPRTADPRRRGESVSLNSGVSATRQSNDLEVDFSVGDTEGVPATAATMRRGVWREGSGTAEACSPQPQPSTPGAVGVGDVGGNGSKETLDKVGPRDTASGKMARKTPHPGKV